MQPKKLNQINTVNSFTNTPITKKKLFHALRAYVFTLRTPRFNLWHLVCLLWWFRTYPKQYLSTGILLVVFWFTVIILEKCNFSPGLKGEKLSLPQNSQRFTQNGKKLVNEISRRIWHCLKREWDIGRKAMLSDFKTALMFAPTLRRYLIWTNHESAPLVTVLSGSHSTYTS